MAINNPDENLNNAFNRARAETITEFNSQEVQASLVTQQERMGQDANNARRQAKQAKSRAHLDNDQIVFAQGGAPQIQRQRATKFAPQPRNDFDRLSPEQRQAFLVEAQRLLAEANQVPVPDDEDPDQF